METHRQDKHSEIRGVAKQEECPADEDIGEFDESATKRMDAIDTCVQSFKGL